MRITLIQAAKAYAGLQTLKDQLLPCRIAKAVSDNQKKLEGHVIFLNEEEQKIVQEYGAVGRSGAGMHVENDPERNQEFIERMKELQSMEVEEALTPIQENQLIGSAILRPSDWESIQFMMEEGE